MRPTAASPLGGDHVPGPGFPPGLAAWQSGNGAMQARPTRLRPVAREPRAAAAPASVGPASDGDERSRCDANHDAIFILVHGLLEGVVVPLPLGPVIVVPRG